MRTSLRRAFTIFTVFTSGALASCGGDDGPTGPPPIASITLSPGTLTLTFVGATGTLTAVVRDEGGGTPQVALTWSSSDPSVAEVSSSGVVTARSTGSATITASAGGVTSNTAAVAVSQQVSNVSIDQASLTFASLGETQALSASARDQGGTPVDGAAFVWVSTDPTVVMVSPAGEATAVGNGSAIIRASTSGGSADVPVTVAQVAAEATLVSAAAVALSSVGETFQVEIEASDARGNTIGAPAAGYTSSDPLVASVSSGGLIRSEGNGAAQISIAVDGVAVGPVDVTVQQVVVGIQTSTNLLVVDPGEGATLTAQPVDALGSPAAGAGITWAGADPAVATVGTTGSTVTATGVADGITEVTASGAGFESEPVEIFVGNGGVTTVVSGDRLGPFSGTAGLQRFFKITVPAGVGELVVGTGGGTGDLDLFMRFGELPTNDFNDEDQLSSGQVDNGEAVQVANPQAGDWFILVDAFADFVDAELMAQIKMDPPGFDIALEFVSTLTPAQQNIVRQAADRWETILTADLFPFWIESPDVCGLTGINQSGVVDDLVVYVGLFNPDGLGGTLAGATPCSIRGGGGQDNLPFTGAILVDQADIDDLEASGQLLETVLHEFGHIMGIGSLWPAQFTGLIAGAGGNDPHFTGPLASQAFDDAGGTTYTGGMRVPVENTGGTGTRDLHWRESVMDDELMTGFAEQNPGEKLSRITLQALRDMGWPAVDLTLADPYQLPGSAAVAGPAQFGGKLRVDDVLWVDIYQVDLDGGVTLIRPGTQPPIRPLR